MHPNPNKVGLVVGSVFGGLHLVWSILVLLGFAQALANFSMWAHMAHFPLVIGPFDPTAAVTVIVIASLIGYVIGYVAGVVWNRVHQM